MILRHCKKCNKLHRAGTKIYKDHAIYLSARKFTN
jgi:hypothetical protein